MPDSPPIPTSEVRGWIVARRSHKGTTFVDISDTARTFQVVVSHETPGSDVVEGCPLGSALRFDVVIRARPNNEGDEFHATGCELIAQNDLLLEPRPTSHFDALDERFADRVTSFRHIYLRNPQVAACMKARSRVLVFLHNWFNQNGFLEFSAPVLTALPLYAGRTAVSLRLHDEDIFLTQCVGYYLEAASHALGNVYNLGPSFRGEESRSRRHLTEYWHVKGEMLWADRESLMATVEKIIQDVVAYCNQECDDIFVELGTRKLDITAVNGPYPRISYRDAIHRLDILGSDTPFGESLNSQDEAKLAGDFSSPFWVVGNPRAIEPFPYVVDPSDAESTMTADLIATGDYGELLGVAEKIWRRDELEARMIEKGKPLDDAHRWLLELRSAACVPHGGFGMGLERLLRWIFGTRHVRDFSPFPRLFGRSVYP